jgi:EAL and modified HD-GYP domain-containing signal transduction protein
MQAQYHLGRQPILDRKGNLVAYELLFRNSTQNSAQVSDDFLASAHVIQNAISQIGLERLLGNRLGFINVSADLLLSDVIELLPREQVVLEILETVSVTPAISKRCTELAKAGFKFALDDIVSPDQEQLALLPYAQFVKIDVMEMPAENLTRLTQRFMRHPVKLLAEKVDSPAQRDFCLKAGFELFQGYYFARPTIISGRTPNPSQLAVLRILGLAHREADSSELETAFKQAPDLTVNLLRLVNSVAFNALSKVGTVNRALTILGRQHLKRWVQLLAFTQADQDYSGMSPLARTAALRGRFMELIIAAHHPSQPDLPEKAFMVGMLSLLDALFQQPLAALINPLNLTDDISTALLERKGGLGKLLSFIEDIEQNRPLVMKVPDNFNQLYADAMQWVDDLEMDS